MLFSGRHQEKASTMSLSVLVVIEMLNAMNSLSENESLVTMPLWKNWYLIIAILTSMILHVMILEVGFFNAIFHIQSLSMEEWKWVFMISGPVILIDEGLKLISRTIVMPIRKLKVKEE